MKFSSLVWILSSLLGQADEAYVKAEERKVEKFRRVLETSPADPEASMAVGKFLCFVKADWEHGLPMLATGKDQALVKLAMTDLGTATMDTSKSSPLTGAIIEFGEETSPSLVKGDQWWSEASKHNGTVEKLNIYNRAAYWYRKAIRTVDISKRKKLYARIDAHSRAIGAIELTIPATSVWVDTGVDVIEGQRIKITAKGTWCAMDDKPKSEWCPYSGYAKSIMKITPIPDAIFMCLIGKVGDGKMFAVYRDNPHESESDGRLFLGPNDWMVSDNQGELKVTIELSLNY
jgi:hypothetical protein